MYPYVDWPFVTNVTETVFIWDDFGHGIVIRFQRSAISFLPRATRETGNRKREIGLS